MKSPHNVSGRIAARMLWVLSENPELGRKQARTIAARETAQEIITDRRKQRQAKSSIAPLSHSRHADDPRGTLLSRILAVATRLWTPLPEHRPADLSAEPAEPPPPRSSLAEHVRSAFEPPVCPQPSVPEYPLVRADGSSATLIPESTYPPRFRDQTTANWRASIEDNVVSFEERRGGSRSIYVGMVTGRRPSERAIDEAGI